MLRVHAATKLDVIHVFPAVDVVVGGRRSDAVRVGVLLVCIL